MAVVHHKLVLFGRKDTGRILDKFSTSRWNDKARTECDSWTARRRADSLQWQ